MLQNFKSRDELIQYFGSLEERIKCLEEENHRLLEKPLNPNNFNDDVMADYLSEFLPDTNLLDKNFFKRAFAVWGHFL